LKYVANQKSSQKYGKYDDDFWSKSIQSPITDFPLKM